ncbi:Ubiquinone/menaquinone biosynthesis C-methylase UbiE [Thermomonospora echinospora]|uniref:Ubiquinone/menaquinone biosynthesis C-methylase UbiE n=1 Tax=Thermomonospora echinospora TaxID=1992 RepID=A0A1H6DEE3_9ACTN|nr:methyltransferase [Thermomonospora echinospora]SEG83620.1 Ubiquinone/menaquinone biosynthesis C-methylase UbiE [Thermomonospora echinospora]
MADRPDQRPPAGADLVPILFGHNAFQQLNAGCELGLFDLLAEQGPLAAAAVADALGLGRRAADILLLGTTALRLTLVEDGRYRNGPAVETAFADGTWPVLRDIVEFQARVSYAPAADYAESLRTGENVGIRRFPGDSRDLYSRLSNVPGLEELFYRCMNSWSRLSNPVLVEEVDYAKTGRVLDVGGGDAVNALALARAHPHLEITVLDRPGALEVARRNIDAAGLAGRVGTHAADIFDDDYPRGHDCVLFAHQLVIWSPEQNRRLLRKAHDAVEPGGRVLVFNAFCDDDGSGPLYAALDNVYFATLPFRDSTIYRWCEHEEWLRDAGFTDLHRITGAGWTPHGVIEGLRGAT